jgi:hypothetical protein
MFLPVPSCIGEEDTMTPQVIHDAVIFLQTRGHTVTPVGPDQWYVHITFPYFPSLTIDEQIPSTQLVDVYAALGGQPLRAAESPPAEAGRV